jgi:cytochrome c
MKAMLRPLIVLALSAASTAALAAPAKDEAALGKRLFLRCTACHAVSSKAPAKVGPHLQAIVGRKGGSVAGFGYSPAMKGANVVWNEATLDKWLQRPQAVVPGTTMAFAGLPNAADRKALIAYLKKPVP